MGGKLTAENAESAETGRGRVRGDARPRSSRAPGLRSKDLVDPARLEIRRLGLVPYSAGLELQERLVRERRGGEIPDQLLLLEHPHVITLGSSGQAEHVLAGAEERRLLGIELFETGRGGDVTYHGPGQLVGYPILALEPERRDLHQYLRDIERALILALADFGVEARRRDGLTGVWVGAEKIAAIGVRTSTGWITSHGFALNVNTDLRLFDSIVPCGIREYGVTSLERCSGEPMDMEKVGFTVANRFAEIFDRDLMDQE